ncbi:unnamed protein product [Camellia sinensis]
MEGLKIPLLFSSLFSILIISNAVDTITKTQSKTGNNTSVSSGGSFEMGFSDLIKTVVWVANREIPLINSSGVLTVINPGILALINGTGTVIWSVNVTESTQNPIAQLMDTGNLVVKDANDKSENFLWQSFDYPCDTQLPGMKLGKNFETGLERHITSWRSSDDPAQGDYKYQRDPQGCPQNILSYGSVELFRTGPWNGIGFSGTPNEEAYYHYALLSPVLSRYDVSYDGHVWRWIWVHEKQEWEIYLIIPTDYCDIYNLCGPNGNCQIGNSPACGCLNNFVPRTETEWRNGYYSNGCVRRTPLDCRNGDDFLMYSRYKMPDTRNSWFDTNMTLGECKMRCLKICSCTAYTNLDIRGDGSGCLLWFNQLIDMREFSEDGPDIYLRMASSKLGGFNSPTSRLQWQEKRYSGSDLGIVIWISSAGYKLDHVSPKNEKEEFIAESRSFTGIRMHNSEQGYTNKSQKEDLKLPLFDLAVIANSTNNLSINNKIGEGGFGAVYKGILEGGQEIAVKQLSKNSSQRLDEFKNEVICINKLQHRNLVKLLGCCIQGEETMLIYEYMPNKSLDYFIFGSALIIHRDLKASNILLDIDMNPKISDFGIARSFGGNETEANTNTVVGTYGYISPAYVTDGLFSIKSDVFSFGVLVLEIVSSKKNKGFYHSSHRFNLLGHLSVLRLEAWNLYKEGKSLQLIDDVVWESCYLIEVLRSIHVGLWCVQESPEDRPSMSSVVVMLSSEGALPQAKQPGFFTERNVLKTGFQEATTTANEITVTMFNGR